MSTEHQRYSTVNQMAEIARFAEEHGLTITQTYKDEGRSGLDIERRPGLRALIADVQTSPAFTHILVYDVSRWGRFQDIDESAHYEYICRRAGVEVYYCAETFTMEKSLANDILKTIKRAMAGEYSRELSAKVFKGQLRLANMGYRQGGSLPFGFRRLLISETGEAKALLSFGEYKSLATDRVIFVHGPADEVEIVGRIYHLFVKGGLSPLAIAQYLNLQGYSGKNGHAWGRQAVVNILKHEIYIGNYVYNRTSSKLGCPRTDNPGDAWIRAVGVVPPMILETLFRAAQSLIKQRSGPNGRSYAVTNSKGARRFAFIEHGLVAEDLLGITGNNADGGCKLENGYRCYRTDSNSAGWTAMVTLDGVRYTKYFSDHLFGSAEQSRAAAEEAGSRDRGLHEELLRLRRRLDLRSNSRTTMPGVTRINARPGRGSHWVAYWIDDTLNKRVYRRFSIDQLGEELSKERALQARMTASEKDRLRLHQISTYLTKQDWRET